MLKNSIDAGQNARNNAQHAPSTQHTHNAQHTQCSAPTQHLPSTYPALTQHTQHPLSTLQHSPGIPSTHPAYSSTHPAYPAPTQHIPAHSEQPHIPRTAAARSPALHRMTIGLLEKTGASCVAAGICIFFVIDNHYHMIYC
ncbi:hypothetical protein GC101_20910 [Paenibacillus sp. LMG 31459]|uniref:Uncharacterized protein n=1 Tax=Paenibacillus phytohabitans TaxID=2654978 RepID=A0ABX1YJW5_9BACL|nr:hypothetical protein [Paenibacillus phytohabitans]